MSFDELDATICRDCHLPPSEVDVLSLHDKMMILGYKPKGTIQSLLNPIDLAKPAHLKRPLPGYAGK